MRGDDQDAVRRIAGPAVAPPEGDRHVLIAGTIASGKTTLTEALAARLGLPAISERPDANPFLVRFYADRRRWALASQLWFALDSARQHQEIHRRGGAVQDHSIYENIEVFGAALAAHGELAEDEWALLREATGPVLAALPPPAVVVLLEAPVEELLRRVRARARTYEDGLGSGYLAELSSRRRAYFEGWDASPVLLVDSAAVDVRTSGGVDLIAARVLEYLDCHS